MADTTADGPTTFKMTEGDLQGEGKVISVGPKWQIKKIQVKKNEDGQLELRLSDKS